MSISFIVTIKVSHYFGGVLFIKDKENQRAYAIKHIIPTFHTMLPYVVQYTKHFELISFLRSHSLVGHCNIELPFPPTPGMIVVRS